MPCSANQRLSPAAYASTTSTTDGGWVASIRCAQAVMSMARYPKSELTWQSLSPRPKWRARSLRVLSSWSAIVGRW